MMTESAYDDISVPAEPSDVTKLTAGVCCTSVSLAKHLFFSLPFVVCRASSRVPST